VIATLDEQATALFRDWIRSMKPENQFVRDWKLEDLLPLLDKADARRSFESAKPHSSRQVAANVTGSLARGQCGP